MGGGCTCAWDFVGVRCAGVWMGGASVGVCICVGGGCKHRYVHMCGWGVQA